MDFGLNEQQEMLQKSAREFLKDTYSDKMLAQMSKEPRGYSDEMWNKMAELGWMALSIPEEYGGIGDFLDLILILKEMGHAGFISPYFSTMILGASLITDAGNSSQKLKHLPAISEGRQRLTLAWNEEPADYTAGAIKKQIKAEGENFEISGRKLLVPDAGSADYFICAFRTSQHDQIEKGITLFIIDAQTKGVSCHLLDTISPDKYYEVNFDKVVISRQCVLGEVGQGWSVLQKILHKAAVAACALMLGGEERVLDMTLTYAKDRAAFGHPIGAYQSIQHRCADMLTDLEGSRHVTFQAAWRINQGLPAEREIAIAKAWVGQAYRRIVSSAHQIHGAIGFTEDHILHWYTRRARALDVHFGDVNYHLGKLAKMLER